MDWGLSSADRARLLGKIKSAKRGWLKNKEKWKAEDAAAAKAEEKARLDAAATRIQKRVRGKKVRKQKEKEVKAATAVQAAVRGRQARSKQQLDD